MTDESVAGSCEVVDQTLVVRLADPDRSDPAGGDLLHEYTTLLDREEPAEVVLINGGVEPDTMVNGAGGRLARRAADHGVPQVRIVFGDHRAVLEELSSRTRGSEPRLTEKQREALTRAYEAGYFEVPRRATLGDLAEEFGTSKQALSERLRRGIGHLADDLDRERRP